MAATRPLKLIDRADMVKDHFCIGRECGESLKYWEYWSENINAFCSAGTVVVGKKEARAKLREVRAFLKLKPQDQRLKQFEPGRALVIVATGMTTPGFEYEASLQLKTVKLSASADSPQSAAMLLGCKTATWLQTGNV